MLLAGLSRPVHSLVLIFGKAQADTCGQNRKLLGDWFVSHGSPDLLLDPIPQYVAEVTEDPYLDPNNPPYTPTSSAVCGIRWSVERDDRGLRKYHLKDFANSDLCSAENFTITHQGHCGACSTVQDLGVYIRQNLTSATRNCGLLGSLSYTLMRNCLHDLGFSDPCVSIWAWNIINTRTKCFKVCVWSYITNEPFNKPDGSLNDCLQCDEDLSGPNFKFFSGRTRRNSGITSAIYRPPDTIYNMEHCYWYGQLSNP